MDDPAHNAVLGIGSTGANTITLQVGVTTQVTNAITTATYVPSTGDLVITSPDHGYSGIQTYTPNLVTYNPSTGVLRLTLDNNHGWQVGERVKLLDDSLVFKCDLDGRSLPNTHILEEPIQFLISGFLLWEQELISLILMLVQV